MNSFDTPNMIFVTLLSALFAFLIALAIALYIFGIPLDWQPKTETKLAKPEMESTTAPVLKGKVAALLDQYCQDK